MSTECWRYKPTEIQGSLTFPWHHTVVTPCGVYREQYCLLVLVVLVQLLPILLYVWRVERKHTRGADSNCTELDIFVNHSFTGISNGYVHNMLTAWSRQSSVPYSCCCNLAIAMIHYDNVSSQMALNIPSRLLWICVGEVKKSTSRENTAIQ